jgi:uncharacterized protein
MNARIGIEMRAAHFPGRAPIDAYGNGGFRFADMSHRGSIMVLPSGIYGWEPADREKVTASDLDAAVAEAGEIEFLLLGTGADLRPMPRAERDALRASGLRVEVMATGAALRTLNVLIAEDRAVAAALIAVE